MAAGASNHPGSLGGWRGDPRPRHSPANMSGGGSWSEDETPGPGEAGGGGRENNKRSNLDSGPQEHRRPYSPVAETLFRKDLISAMKLPDNEPLEAEDYWTVTDTWKQEWERGVQVPVKPDGLPEAHVSSILPSSKSERFTLPKKLICMNTSGSYKAETHQVTPMVLRAEQVCTYDLDNCDQTWLATLNGERARTGLSNLTETEMERTVEELEKQCWDKINTTLRNSDDIDIAQDDSIICDVCRSPDSEDANEMVFCDQCNICVHQACYGITTIPSGSWLCRTCTLGIKPPCELCPNKGGAMKSTRTGSKWAHVSCALWIPEVSIGCVEKMEPITKISSIPQSRWSLVCVLCKERMGSCIQCSVKTCKTAYHVTCAFKHNLEMRAIIEDENAEDGVKLRSYCQKHSLNSKKKEVEDSDSESGAGGSSRKSNMTKEEKSQARRQRMAKVEKEFYKLVDVVAAAKKIDLSEELVDIIYKYWTLKRVASGNKPLLPSKGEDEALSALRGEDTERDKMKMMVSVRQDLERVRNLAYMVSRREKMSRSFVKLKEQILEKQLALLADEDPANQMSLMEMSAVCEANHGPSIYDKIFSNPDAEQTSPEDFEAIICRIAGEIKEGSSQIRKDNPFRKKSTDVSMTTNRTVPYERIFSDTSQSESDDSFIQNVKPETSRRSSIDKKKKKGPDKKSSLKPGKNKVLPSSKKPVTRSDSSMSSSEEEDALKNMLSPTKKDVSATNVKSIYSDSDSEDDKSPRGRGRPPKKQRIKEVKNSDKTESGSEVIGDSEDTQNSMDSGRPKEFRTKAAMKAFTAEDMALAKRIMEEKQRGQHKSSEPVKNKSKKSTESKQSAAKSSSDDDSIMEIDPNDVDPDLNAFLLVPQRGAARKAEQKMSKTSRIPTDGIVDLKKSKGSKSVGLFGTSDDDSRDSKDPKGKKQDVEYDSEDNASKNLRKSPRQSSANKKKQTSTDSESEVEDVTPSNHKQNKSSKVLEKNSTTSVSVDNEALLLKNKSRTSSPVKKGDRSKHILSDSKISPKDKKKKIEECDTSEDEIVSSKSHKSSKISKSDMNKNQTKSKNKTKPSLLSGSDDDSLEKRSRERNKSGNKKSKKQNASSDSDDELLKKVKQDSVISNKAKEKAEFDDLFSKEQKLESASDSDSELGKKKLFDDFEHPEMLPFVPQRRAAKKASAQLSEQNLWKKTQQEAYLAELAQIQAEKEAHKKNLMKQKNRKVSPSIVSSDSDNGKKRSRSSESGSSSDSDSDRDKSPRGRGRSPKGNKAKTKKPQTKKAPVKKSRSKKSPKSVKTDGKIASSKALEYLMQRESEISKTLEEFEKEAQEEAVNSSQDPPDKKLKTSEGRPDGIQSPPASPKNSSDSDSDSDSDDSVIRGIKARKKKEAEDAKSSAAKCSEVKKEEDESKPSDIMPTITDKRVSRPDSPGGAKRTKRSDSENASADPLSKELNHRQSGRRSGDSHDISVEQPAGSLRSGRPSRDGGSSSRERMSTTTRTTPSQSQQLKQATPRESPSNRGSPAQKKSIFSPDRSPRTSSDPSRSCKSPAAAPAESKAERNNTSAQRECDTSGEKENEGPGSWRSPRERKQGEPGSHGSQTVDKISREIPAATKSPSKSPALSRSYTEGSRSSPMQTHRSPAFGRSPARHSQHPLNKSLDLNKSMNDSLDSSKTELVDVNNGTIVDKVVEKTLNKSDNEPEEEQPSIDSRKFSVESKDSDGDSAKSSLPDASINGLPDFSKEDSTDTLDFGDKLSDLRDNVVKDKEQVPTLSKTDEGYVSGGKVQNNDLNAQMKETSNFLPNFQTSVTSDKSSHVKESEKTNGSSSKTPNNIRLSTDESVSSLELALPKANSQASNAWSELQNLTQSSAASMQQHLLEDPRSWQLQQQAQTDIGKQQQKLDSLTNSNDKKVADALAASQHQQQAAHSQYEAFLNQMFHINKAATGQELTHQQQMAYAQQYMKELGYGKGLEFQTLNQNLDLLSQQINYQNISQQMNYQHYVQQMQQAAYGLNKKVQNQTELQLLSAAAWQAQQQEAAGWYQRQLGDLEKMTQGGLRELEKMALTQGKDKPRQSNPATSSAQDQRSFIERLAQQQDKEIRLQEQMIQEQKIQEQKVQEEKRLLEEKRVKEEQKRLQEEKRKQDQRKMEEEQLRIAEEQRKVAEEQQRKIAEEQQRKLAEEQQRKLAEEQQRKLAEEQQRKLIEEQQRKLIEEQQRLFIEEQQRKLAEERQRKMVEEHQRKLAEEQKRREEEQRRLEEEKKRLEEEKRRREEELREEERKRDEEKRIREEKIREEQRKREEEEQKKREEELKKREEEERKRLEEFRRMAEEEQIKRDEERKKREEEDRKQLEELRRLAEEEQIKMKEEQRRLAAEEERRIVEEQHRLAEEQQRKMIEMQQQKFAEEQRKIAEEHERKLAEEQRKIAEELERKMEEEHQRKLAEEQQRKIAEEQKRKKAEEEQRKNKEEEQRKIAEEEQKKAEEEQRKITERQAEEQMQYERYQSQFYDAQRSQDFLRQQQDILLGYGSHRQLSQQEQYLQAYGPRDVANQLLGGEKHNRDLVGQVEDQLGALTGGAASLFSVNKDQNSNQEKSANSFDLFAKQGSASKPSNKSTHKTMASPNHRGGRPASPRTEKTSLSSCQVEQQELLMKQQYGIPSATPADKLPGFTPSIPSREHKRQSHESHSELQDVRNRDIVGETRRGRDTPQSVAGSETSHNSAPSGIPNELLDSIRETAKLPVWKPPDKVEGQGFSPAKPPVPSPPKPAPVTSERDSSFDDLVRHIDSSPSQKDNKSDEKSSNHKLPLNEYLGKSHSSAHTAKSDHASASEAERSDYDNDNFDHGGVDYDDPDDDLPLGRRMFKQKEVSPQKPDALSGKQNNDSPPKPYVGQAHSFSEENSEKEDKPAERLTKRGTKAPCYAEKTEDEFGGKKESEQPQPKPPVPFLAKGKSKGRQGRGGVFGGRRGGPKYDPKAFEKVHKNLAGTDFDFEDEFDDDFGSGPMEKEMPTSLKGFREQSKKAPIYMQDKKTDNSFDFDDLEPSNDQIPPVLDDSDDVMEVQPEEVKPVSKPKAKGTQPRKRHLKGIKALSALSATLTGSSERFPPAKPVEEIPEDVPKESSKEEEPREVPKVVISLRKRPEKVEEPSSERSDDEQEEIPTRRTRRGIKQMKETSVSKERLLLKSREKAPIPHIIDSDDDEPKVKETSSLIVQKPISKKDDVNADPDFKLDKTKPKIPTLKIKLGRTDSPVSVGSDEGEKVKKRRGSVDMPREDRKTSFDNEDDGIQQRIPKLKIKIGGPKPMPSEKPQSESSIKSVDDVDDLLKDDLIDEPPPLIIRTTPSSSPHTNKVKTPTQNTRPLIPVVDVETGERLSTSELALEAMKSGASRSSPKSSASLPPSAIVATSTSFPKQKPKSIDSLATKLLAKQQSTPTSSDKASELQNIFGPEEPLQQLNIGTDGGEDSSVEQERGEEGPSELELLAEELSKQLAKEKQMKQLAEEAAKLKEVEIVPSNNNDGLDFEEELQHHDPKYKFKHLNKPSYQENEGGRQTSSPGPTTPVKINLTHNSVVDSNPLRRMRKKELLNQYYGIELPAAPTHVPMTNGPTVAVIPDPPPPLQPSLHHRGGEGGSHRYERHREPVRMNIIKMPKAVASVTSVPTRADYQSQLEANLERKRKREGKEDPKLRGKKGGKGKKQKDEWEEPYKPKIKMNQLEGSDGESEQTKEVRRTRGKPIKKCLAVDDSPERDPVESFIENKKNESLKFAEEVLKSFEDEEKPEREKRRKDRREKKRRRDAEDDISQPNTKTPRIVIKFSKNPPKQKDNGLIKPNQAAPKQADSEGQKKLPKIKIKNLIEPSKT